MLTDLNICEAEIDAAWVAGGVSIADDVFDLRCEAIDEAVGQDLDPRVICLHEPTTPSAHIPRT
jgi:hypothetical protein